MVAVELEQDTQGLPLEDTDGDFELVLEGILVRVGDDEETRFQVSGEGLPRCRGETPAAALRTLADHLDEKGGEA